MKLLAVISTTGALAMGIGSIFGIQGFCIGAALWMILVLGPTGMDTSE